MTDTYDLILKGATIVNHDGKGVRDIAIRAGRIAAIGALASAKAAEMIDCGGLHILPGVIDTPGAFPRAGAGAQGGSGDRQPRRRARRGHGRIRDAQHEAADDLCRDACRQSAARPDIACSATSRSTSAARARTSPTSRCWSGSKARPASRCSWARRPATCWSTTRPRSIASLRRSRRRAAFHAEDEDAAESAHASARARRSVIAPRLARRRGGADRDAAAGQAGREAQARASTCCTSRPPTRWRSWPITRIGRPSR